MKVSITCIVLKSPFHFFKLSLIAWGISNQLKKSNCLAFKKKGFWTKHYTMTLWKNEEEMKAFVLSGAHFEAGKKSKSIAKEIRTVTIDADRLPDWDDAQNLLKTKGKSSAY